MWTLSRKHNHADKLLSTDMKQLMPTSADGKEENLYILHPRNKLFRQKNITYPIHATLYATTYMDHLIGVNVDSQNPNIHD